ncbi:MAG: hypothetical protein AABZ30_14420 [Myxococcota bacterium]
MACVAFATESPLHTRVDVNMADVAQALRRFGIPSRQFQVLFDPSDEAENGRRVDRLVRTILAHGCRLAVFHEVWIPALGDRLIEGGLRLVELRTHTYAKALFVRRTDELASVAADCRVERPLDALSGLVAFIAGESALPSMHFDLNVGQSCGYRGAPAENAFYEHVRAAPEVSRHRGCSYCLAAVLAAPPAPTEEMARRIVETLRRNRAVFPDATQAWLTYPETFLEPLAMALAQSESDPVWRGLTFSFQTRPDVLVRSAPAIERMAERLAVAGAMLRVAVVGFENFSERELLVLNRGTRPSDLDESVAILRRWTAQPPPGLVAAGYTPSFILFTPWTRFEDLELNVRAMEVHGLWNANIERLRVGPGTPVYEKARREGLLEGGSGRPAQHPNGYSTEFEVRFVDPRTASAATGFDALKRLAYDDQTELLGGLLDAVRRAEDPSALDWEAVARDWTALRDLARAGA